MTIVGQAFIRIRPDDAGFSDEAEKGILGKVGGIATKAAGVFAAGFALKQGFDFFGGIITKASDLGETMSKVGVVFGGATDQVAADAKFMADSFGIPKQAFLDASASIGLIGKASGLAQSEVGPFSTGLARLATDASSFFNVPLEEALLAIQSGLTGEAEPLRRFGVLLNEASVSAEAAALGLGGVGRELTDGEKVQARASLITKGLADANGDLERTQGSLSNRLRELKGRLQNFTTEMGAKAIPVVIRLMDAGETLGKRLGPVFSGVGEFIRNAFAPGQADVTWLDSLVGGVRALIGAFQNASDGITSSGFAGTMERIGIVARQVSEFVRDNIRPILIGLAGAFLIAAGPVVAIGAALVLLYTRFSVVRDVIAAVSSFLTGTVAPAVAAFASYVSEQFGNLVGFVQEHWAAIQEAIGHVVEVVRFLIEDFIGGVQAAWRVWGDEILNIAQVVWDQIRNIVETTVGIISGLIAAGLAIINGDWGQAWDAIKGILSTAWDFITETVRNAVSALREVVEGGLSGIVEFVGGVPGQIGDRLESLVGIMGDIGERAVRAMADAIGGAIGWVLDAAGSLISKVKDKLMFWESPPELFGQHLGERLVGGIVKGLENDTRILSAAEALVAKMKDELSGLTTGDWMRPSRASDYESFAAWVRQNPTEEGEEPYQFDQMREAFVTNSQRDPNAGRPGYRQRSDGFWEPVSGSNYKIYTSPTGERYNSDREGYFQSGDTGGRVPGYRYDASGNVIQPGQSNGTMILSITGPLVTVEGSVIPGQEEELGRMAEKAVINMVRNGTVGREMSNRTAIISRR
jgi:hypothetical protein